MEGTSVRQHYPFLLGSDLQEKRIFHLDRIFLQARPGFLMIMF